MELRIIKNGRAMKGKRRCFAVHTERWQKQPLWKGPYQEALLLMSEEQAEELCRWLVRKLYGMRLERFETH